ncbi:MAG: cytochrome c biogenesis protein CcsA [Coriobacteriia bacterium]|nr:cytochrome c biogenesis protein CcsA [Coriobacteriia bacterium]
MKQLKIAVVLVLIGGVLTTVAFLMAFYTAEVQQFGTVTFDAPIETVFPVAPDQLQPAEGIAYVRPWFSQKIFYFHVPVAEASFLVLIISAIFAVRFLMTKRAEYDTKSRIAMETSLVFVVLTMITGVLWTKASWGVWWEWEPRLTTYFIMMLMMIAYFVLRNSIEEEERRATYAAVFAILAAINAPLSFMITRVIPSNHPVVFQPGMASSNLMPFIVAQIGMLMIGYGIYVSRMSEERLRERVEIAKETLEG